MKICPKCNAQVGDNATFCTSCGTPLGGAPVPQNPAPNAYAAPVKPTDHTAEFAPNDVHGNKLLALTIYAFSLIGVFLAVIANIERKSDYLKFHINQGLKILVCETIVSVLTVLLSWTCIVPFAGGVALIMLFVIQVICFIQTCRNKSVEAPLLSSLGFLK